MGWEGGGRIGRRGERRKESERGMEEGGKLIYLYVISS